MSIVPNFDQIQAFTTAPDVGPVVMINLLKFSAGDRGSGDGRAAYGRYGERVVKMIEAQGGKVIWSGRPEQVFIGDPVADAWDTALLVWYPSRRAFIEMVNRPDYADAHRHREQGLERTVVLACTPTSDAIGTVR